MAKKSDNKKVKVTLVKSTIGCVKKQKDTVAALGLDKINSFKIHDDTATLKGMISVVNHLVKVEEV